MEIWELIQPTPSTITAAKNNYNRLLVRMNKATDFVKTIQDQDEYAIEIRIEILEPMGKYIQILKNWDVVVSDIDIRDGFKL